MPRTFLNFVFALVLLALVYIPLASLNLTIEVSDFPLYYKTAQLFCAGKGADVYLLNPQLGKIGAGLNEPPFLLWAVAPIGLLSYAAAKIVFDTTMVILLATASIVLSKAVKLSDRQTMMLLALLVLSGPVWEILRLSKPSPLLFLGLSCCVYCLQKDQVVKAGAWATLCLLKPQEILPFLVFALGCLRIRFLLAFTTVVLLLAAMTFPLFGVEGYTNYLHRISFLNTNVDFSGTGTMPILAGQLLRLGVSSQLATGLSPWIYALGVLCLFIFGLMNRKNVRWWIKGTVVAVVSMAWLFPYMLAYDLVIIIPGICYLFQDLARRTNKLPLVCASLSVLSFLQPVYAYIRFYLTFLPVDLHFCALVVLAVTGTTQFKGAMNDTELVPATEP